MPSGGRSRLFSAKNAMASVGGLPLSVACWAYRMPTWWRKFLTLALSMPRRMGPAAGLNGTLLLLPPLPPPACGPVGAGPVYGGTVGLHPGRAVRTATASSTATDRFIVTTSLLGP